MSITELFASDVLVKILLLFLLHPEKAFYQAEIQNRIQGHLYNTQTMLKKLEHIGLITSHRQGRMTYYKAEKEHPAFEDLKRLFLKTVAIGEVLRENLDGLSSQINFAFIFGSFARGEESADSDIDICILGDLSLKDISRVLGDIHEIVGREVNPVIYTIADYQNKLVAEHRFVQELLSCSKIWLIGTEHEFQEMALGRQN